MIRLEFFDENFHVYVKQYEEAFGDVFKLKYLLLLWHTANYNERIYASNACKKRTIYPSLLIKKVEISFQIDLQSNEENRIGSKWRREKNSAFSDHFFNIWKRAFIFSWNWASDVDFKACMFLITTSPWSGQRKPVSFIKWHPLRLMLHNLASSISWCK